MNNNTINATAGFTGTTTTSVIEIIDKTGMLDLEGLKAFRKINSKINDAATRINMATSGIENLKDKGFFKALGQYMDGKMYMTYNGRKDVTLGDFEKIMAEYNNYILMRENANNEIEELSEALKAYRVPAKYSDLMAESLSGEWEEV